MLRTDIQALRGFAVLLVVLYHAGATVPAAGYLGVDVFFVVSGYLITGLVARSLDDGRFRFEAFYFRRAKRLLPAAYLTYVATTLLGRALLAPTERRELLHQVAGSVGFVANVVLWKQSGYFQGAAALKPLLHIWSLSIEEQCYLFLPALLWLAGPRRRAPALALVVAASLVADLVGLGWKPSATFYLLPTRFWELGLGAVGALVGAVRVPTPAYGAALLALGLVPLAPTGLPHPGADAVLVCVATLAVVLARREPGRSAPVRALCHLGDLSYSLYLIHWPLFALANSAWLSPDPLPVPIRAGLVGLSWALAEAQYRGVERPIRDLDLAPSAGRWATIATASAGVVALGALLLWDARARGPDPRRANTGLAPSCDQSAPFAPDPACATGPAPELLLWGDSFAMHLAPGLAVGDAPLVQATRSYCGPLLGVAPVSSEYPPRWAEACVAFNDEVLEYLRATPSITTVALSSPLTQYLDQDALVRDGDGWARQPPMSPAALAAAIASTASAIRAEHRRVVWVGPPPTGGFDAGRCVERRQAQLPSFGVDPDCRIPMARFRRDHRPVLEAIETAARADVAVLWLDALLCGPEWCPTEDGVPLYRDPVHLSIEGSRRVGGRHHLSRQVMQAAR